MIKKTWGIHALSHLWFWLTSLPEPPPHAPLAQRERARRTRQVSLVLVVIVFAAIAPFPVAIQQRNIAFFVTLIVTLIVYLVALVGFNRRGKLTTAGILVLVVLNGGFLLYFLNIPGGLHTNDLPTFDLMVEASLAAGAFFVPWSILLLAAINILIILLALFATHVSSDLHHLLQTDFYDVVVRPIILQAAAAWIVFFWASSTEKAIKRADQAEYTAELQTKINESQQRLLEQGKQVEHGIETIIAGLTQAMSGDLTVRVPLPQENILWRIARALNLLLTRLQNMNQTEKELERTREVSRYVAACMEEGKPIVLRNWTGTPLDLIIMVYNKKKQGGEAFPIPGENLPPFRESH